MLFSSLPLHVPLIIFFFLFLVFLALLSPFKLFKFSITKIFSERLFQLSLKHKPFLVKSALTSVCQDALLLEYG